MKLIVIIYFLFAMFYSVNLRRQSHKEENLCRTGKISLLQDNRTVRTEDFNRSTEVDLRILKAQLKHVTLYLYTHKNRETAKSFKPNKAKKLKKSKVFDSRKPNIFVIHGWRASNRGECCFAIKNAVLHKADMNVFVVDWNKPASWIYPLARYSVGRIGKFVAQFINDMIRIFSLPPSAFKIVGHSLGAHVAGCAGREINGQIDYVIGLDPAGPLFIFSDKDRLDISHASFVQVIHTNGFYLGYYADLGHVDIYPNNGRQQPGCKPSSKGNTCSHKRACKYFVESILLEGFSTKQCKNYDKFEMGKCDNSHSSYLGRLNIDKTAMGRYYLNTNSESPFSKN